MTMPWPDSAGRGRSVGGGAAQAGSSIQTAIGGLVGGVSNYRGFQLTAGFGWVFGRGH
jgi:hypothetical protein